MTKKRINWPAKLRKLREQLDLTQAQAASSIGVALRTWISWEHGHRRPSGPAEQLLRNKYPELF